MFFSICMCVLSLSLSRLLPSFLCIAEDVFNLTLNVNVTGVFLGCKYGIPAIRRAGGGSVINTGTHPSIHVQNGYSCVFYIPLLLTLIIFLFLPSIDQPRSSPPWVRPLLSWPTRRARAQCWR
jgi:hypothetical protein